MTEAIAAVRELIAEVGLTMRLSDAGATPALRRLGAGGAGGHLSAHQSTHRHREQIIELYAAAQ
jgi:alcohol dehydrogenase